MSLNSMISSDNNVEMIGPNVASSHLRSELEKHHDTRFPLTLLKPDAQPFLGHRTASSTGT
jgi:hypothetical protein